MTENPKSQRHGSVSAKEGIEEAMKQLDIVSNGDGTDGMGDEVGVFPDRPGEPDCIYFMRTGSCGYGSSCRFNHPSNGGKVNGNKNGDLPERAGQMSCGHYLKTGTCKYGSTCRYNHPKDRESDSSVSLNVLGLPLRQDAKPCPYYMRNGSCKYGFACKFHHPQPASAASVLPIQGGTFYGNGESLIAPKSGMQSNDEFSAASLPRPAYLPSPLIPLPQSYTPFILSPSQGWNGYMGSVGPLPVSNVLTAHASNGQLLSDLPERSDQPDCRYFMKHGSCKYGSDCKYHHPRERIAQMTSGHIGPLGLPLRPGEPVCSSYSFYGICKYGPTCKYDHPLNGYPYAYNFGVPPPMGTPYPPIPYHQPPYEAAAPLKISEWIKKGANAGNDKQISGTKSVEDSPDGSDSPEQSSKPLSEVVDESD